MAFFYLQIYTTKTNGYILKYMTTYKKKKKETLNSVLQGIVAFLKLMCVGL